MFGDHIRRPPMATLWCDNQRPGLLAIFCSDLRSHCVGVELERGEGERGEDSFEVPL